MYQVLILIDNEWKVASDNLSTISAAKGIQAQMILGGYISKVVRKK